LAASSLATGQGFLLYWLHAMAGAYSAKVDAGFADRIRADYQLRAFSFG
jgi:hypothetical protein